MKQVAKEPTDATKAFAQGKIEGHNHALKIFSTWAMQQGISGAKVAQFQKDNKIRPQ
jgi:hypothetical protein